MEFDSLQFSQLLLAFVIVFHVFVTRSLGRALEGLTGRLAESMETLQRVSSKAAACDDELFVLRQVDRLMIHIRP